MNPPNLFQKLAVAGVAGAIGFVGVQAGAQAGTLINQGYSVFAAPDPQGVPNVEPIPGPDPGSNQCAECDSTVSFAVYKPDTDNWVTEFAAQYGIPVAAVTNLYGTLDTTADHVFLYEVVNTDPLDALEDEIVIFDIAVETKPPIGPWNGPSPYTSGGYIDGTVFTNASTDTFDNPQGVATTPNGTRQPQLCLNDLVPPPGTGQGSDGCPGNWIPDVLDSTFTIGTGDGVAPVDLEYQVIRDDEVERQQAALGFPATSPTNGMSFQWSGADPIEQEGQGITNSYLLFLTPVTEEEFIAITGNPNIWLKKDYPWAKTQSPGGEGTSGDVVGIKVTTNTKVPEPGTMLGLLAIGGLGLGMKRKKS